MNVKNVAAISISLTVAFVATFVCLHIEIPTRYTDFIVGKITWGNHTKYQDLLVGPVTVVSFLVTYVLYFEYINRITQKYGDKYADDISIYVAMWSLPMYAGLLNLSTNIAFDIRLCLISIAGVLYLTITSLFSRLHTAGAPREISSGALLSLFLGVLPIAVALLIGRYSVDMYAAISGHVVYASYFVYVTALIVIGVYAYRTMEFTTSIVAGLFLLAQLFLPLFYLSMLPSMHLSPDGSLHEYKSTGVLEIIVTLLIILTIVDAIRRYFTYHSSQDVYRLISPFAVFALLLALRYGVTKAPVVSSDDYHFGEMLLGYWSYLNGALPYVDYMPPHGILDDYTPQYLSYLLYDGTAGAIEEARRISVILLTLLAFISIYYFSGSYLLAFVSCFFIGERLSWLLLASVLCILFNPRLINKPSHWMVAWLCVVPVFTLLSPSYGVALILSTFIIVLYVLRHLSQEGELKDMLVPGVVFLLVSVCLITTAAGEMLIGALRITIESAATNQPAYGIPWESSWGGDFRHGLTFELTRMSWVIVLYVLVHFLYMQMRNGYGFNESLLPAFVSVLLILLLIPYAMGRIDPGWMSRPGVVSILAWTILLPLSIWGILNATNRMILIAVITIAGSALSYARPVSDNLFASHRSHNTVDHIINGNDYGMENIGYAHVGNRHLQRLGNLKAVLDAYLDDNEAYLDLTSRNAHYYYFNKTPPVYITAPYNMVSGSQQKTALSSLATRPPKLVLIEAKNMAIDGGGVALRNPHLYQFVIDNYVPVYHNGFIIALHDAEIDHDKLHIRLQVKRVDTTNRYVYRVDNMQLLSILMKHDVLRIGSEQHVVEAVDRKKGLLTMVDPLPVDNMVSWQSIEIMLAKERQRDYYMALYSKAFSIRDLQRLPVSWGRSHDSLADKLASKVVVDDQMLRMHHLDHGGNEFVVTGSRPWLDIQLTGLHVSGKEIGLLAMDYNCFSKSQDVTLNLYWWGDHHKRQFEASSLRIVPDNGRLIIPLDSSPWWYMLNDVTTLRIAINNASSCVRIGITNINFYQRVL